jgi:hypothetical protein
VAGAAPYEIFGKLRAKARRGSARVWARPRRRLEDAFERGKASRQGRGREKPAAHAPRARTGLAWVGAGAWGYLRPYRSLSPNRPVNGSVSLGGVQISIDFFPLLKLHRGHAGTMFRAVM